MSGKRNEVVVVRREATGVFHRGKADCSARILAGEQFSNMAVNLIAIAS
jgi:hypothetical protein